MLGAIIGDVVGSIYEWNNVKTKDFQFYNKNSRFTDDTVMTLAVSEACIIYDEVKHDPNPHWIPARCMRWFQSRLISIMQSLGRMYPDAGYGSNFKIWLSSDDPQPYMSYGNGSAMRVSPVAYFADSLEEALALAKLSAEITHNHPEGIKGAQAVTAAVYMALHGADKGDIRRYIEQNFYPLNFTIDGIRPGYKFDVSCQGSVPVAIEAFLEAEDFTDTVKTAISVGGDSDTIAAIACSIAEPYFKEISPGFIDRTLDCLDDHLLGMYYRGVDRRPYNYSK